MNIDAKNMILGRLAAFAAKQALQGKEINIFNCESAIISGKKKDILRRYKMKMERGHPYHGPFYPRTANRLVRRTIRGMLPFKQARGVEAYKRIKCFIGVPEEFKKEKMEDVKGANAEKLKDIGYINVRELCRDLKG